MNRLRQTGQRCRRIALSWRNRSALGPIVMRSASPRPSAISSSSFARVLQPQVVRGQDDRDIAGEVAAGHWTPIPPLRGSNLHAETQYIPRFFIPACAHQEGEASALSPRCFCCLSAGSHGWQPKPLA